MNKSILIDFLVPIAGAGGVEQVINTIAPYLNKNGFHVRIVQLISDGSRWFSPELELYPVLINDKVSSLDELTSLYSAFLEQYGAPAMVIATTWPQLVITARKALMAYGSPCKVLSWLHGPLSEYERYGAGGAECLHFADYHLCISQKAANTILNFDPDAALSIAHNPVNIDSFSAQKAYHIDSRTLLYVGRLSPEKCVDDIIRGLAISNRSNPNLSWKLKIIGDGEMRSKLTQLVSELQLEEYVSFLGWMDSPWSCCNDVTATVLASEYEGSPLCAIESLANGIPVLSTPVDGISELIQPGINGWLYPKHDTQSLADILGLLGNNLLPSISPDDCVASTAPYSNSNALPAFKQALYNAMDTISVIIPCYNVGKYIRRCLDSILNQSISGVRIEVICVDDCSTDDTLSILTEYEQKYPDIFMLIPLSRNMKQGYARNTALTYSNGDYITYVDADDYIDDCMLEKLYLGITKYSCDIVECGYSQFDDKSDDSNNTSCGSEHLYDMRNISDKRSYILNRYWKTGPWGRLYKKQFLIDNNINFAENLRMEDILFSAMCMSHMTSYLLIPGNYYHYYINNNGTMFSKNIRYYYMDTAIVQDMATDYLKESRWYDDCYMEYSYLHYTKAFEEPLWRMCTDTSMFSYDNIILLKNELLSRFPDICSNPYLMKSDSMTTRICLSILSNDLDRASLEAVFLTMG